ncbi:DNA-binding CsgD family transcriptional regulator [Arthrobacter sp. CAN_A212]|uniref:LuxR C-terminal-related transcriptional regulator n=1 Tax=unclassified Arthrobacter TaxID=235627 RepID=UPI0018C9CCF9|nr:LuxR C-terminal-related transcriptional regulator [Arthrobacter sp. CAN_C5]MBP2217748.1 DNA-binding CsgD family transcriptional regulator [Arthrobacter sp. CAN_C5]
MNAQLGAGGLIGRSADIDQVSASILDPLMSGAWVCGPAGIGKSAVASQVLMRLEGTVVPLAIHADSSLSRVPYGALAPLLLDSAPGDLESRLAVLRLIRAALNSVSSEAGLPVLVTVHSAHHLDQESSHLLGQLALAREIRLLVLTRSLGNVPEELYSLCRDGLLMRCELSALGREQVAVLSQRDLGGIVSSNATSFLTDWSQGNPAIIRALISHLRSTRALVERNGVWLLVSTPKSAGDELVERVKALLLGCTPATRGAIEMVAMLGGIPTTAARHLLDPTAMEQGLAVNLLAYSGRPGSRRSRVTVEPRVYGEVIRHLLPPGRRVEILRTLRASQHGREVLAAAGASTSVGWAMDLGDGIPDQELLAAAQQANNGFAPRQAQRFSAAVTTPEFATATRVESARSFLYLADTEAAAAEIRGLIEEAADPGILAEAAVTEAQITLQRGGSAEDLLGIADRWAVVGQRLNAAQNRQDDPAKRDQVECGAAILRHVSHCLAGDYSTAIRGLRGIVGGTVPSSTVGLLSRMLLGEALGATGKTAEAKDLTLAAVATTGENGDLARHYRTAITRHGALLVLTMDEAGFALLRESFDQSAPPALQHFGGNLMTLQGVLDFRCGRIDASCDLLAAGIEELRRHDPEMLLPLALGTAAFASRLVGDNERALGYLQDYRVLPYRGFLPQRLVADGYISAAKSWLAVTNQEVAAIEAGAAEAKSRGLVNAEAEILELLFLLQRPVSAGRLEELANELGATDSDTIRIIALAAASSDPAQLVASGAQALSAGRHLLAAECLARGASEYGRRGEERVQRMVRQQLRGLIPMLGRVRTRAVTDQALTRVALTRREQEIARLAVRGASSQEIATYFTVSRRTVEGHLYRIYLKLGIGGRDDLVIGLLEEGSHEP